MQVQELWLQQQYGTRRRRWVIRCQEEEARKGKMEEHKAVRKCRLAHLCFYCDLRAGERQGIGKVSNNTDH